MAEGPRLPRRAPGSSPPEARAAPTFLRSQPAVAKAIRALVPPEPATYRSQDASTRSAEGRSSRVRQGKLGGERVELLSRQVPLSRLQGVGRSVPEVFGVGGRPTGWRDFLLFACLAT